MGQILGLRATLAHHLKDFVLKLGVVLVARFGIAVI
jgi:hypothetical protein